MTNRRSFLGLLVAAPVIAPALAKEAAASSLYASGVTTVDWTGLTTAGELLPSLETLSLKIDMTHVGEQLDNLLRDKMQHPLDHPRCKRVAGEELFVSCMRCGLGPCSVAPARYMLHEQRALEVPNRLKGVEINQDGDAV